MNRATYERQADTIEQVLATHRIPARVWGGQVTTRAVRYDLTPALGTRLAKVLALKDEIARALRYDPGEITMHRQDGALRLTVPRRDAPPPLPEPDDPPAAARRYPLPYLGLDPNRAPLYLKLASPRACHLALVGSDAPALAAILRALTLALAQLHRPHRLQIALFDPPNITHLALLDRHLIARPAYHALDIDDLAATLHALHDRRRRRDHRRPPVLVVANGWDQLDEPTRRRLHDIVKEGGPATGIHVLAAAAQPDSVGAAPFPIYMVWDEGAYWLRARGQRIAIEPVTLAAEACEAQCAALARDLPAHTLAPGDEPLHIAFQAGRGLSLAAP